MRMTFSLLSNFDFTSCGVIVIMGWDFPQVKRLKSSNKNAVKLLYQDRWSVTFILYPYKFKIWMRSLKKSYNYRPLEI
jgi:hypothetical protein